MSGSSTQDTTQTMERRQGRRRLVSQFVVELLIGFAVAALLVIVGWASSNAIRFVYGGY